MPGDRTLGDTLEPAATRRPRRAAEQLGYVRNGSLLVATDASSRDLLLRQHCAISAVGVAAELLDARACAAAEPALRPLEGASSLAMRVPQDAQLDARRAASALAASCARLGHGGRFQLRFQTRVQRLLATACQSAVTGVAVDGGGVLHCRCALDATAFGLAQP